MKPMRTMYWVFIAILALLTLKCVYGVSSGYREIVTNASETPDIFKLKGDVMCTPGPSENAAYYNVDSGGGAGLCGDNEYIQKTGHGYQIQNGIGGSLLDKDV